jgi:hypothetical protein
MGTNRIRRASRKWARLALNGAVAGLLSGLLFWDRSPQEIAVLAVGPTIALLVLPYLYYLIRRFVREPEPISLGEALEGASPAGRVVILGTLILSIVAVACVLVGVLFVMAAPIYAYAGLGWAVRPALELGLSASGVGVGIIAFVGLILFGLRLLLRGLSGGLTLLVLILARRRITRSMRFLAPQ